jgi:hypothetical protein
LKGNRRSQFEVLSRQLPGGIQEKCEKTTRISNVAVEIRNVHLPRTVPGKEENTNNEEIVRTVRKHES